MFGWKLLRESEIALQALLTDARIAAIQTQLQAAKAYTATLERLVEHERTRIDMERDRADRIADGRFQADGLPPVSLTVRSEQKAADKTAADAHEAQMKEIVEIYGDMEHELAEDGVEPLPEELAEMVK